MDDTQGDAPRAMGLRAGAGTLVGAVMSTERAVGALVIGALVLLVVLRRGFRGVLGG